MSISMVEIQTIVVNQEARTEGPQMRVLDIPRDEWGPRVSCNSPNARPASPGQISWILLTWWKTRFLNFYFEKKTRNRNCSADDDFGATTMGQTGHFSTACFAYLGLWLVLPLFRVVTATDRPAQVIMFSSLFIFYESKQTQNKMKVIMKKISNLPEEL